MKKRVLLDTHVVLWAITGAAGLETLPILSDDAVVRKYAVVGALLPRNYNKQSLNPDKIIIAVTSPAPKVSAVAAIQRSFSSSVNPCCRRAGLMEALGYWFTENRAEKQFAGLLQFRTLPADRKSGDPE